MARIVRTEQKLWLVLLIVLSNMATSDLEERQLELEGKICSLPVTRLEELAEHLEVPLMKYSGKSRLIIARALREAIGEGIDSCETVELTKEYLCGLENFLEDKPPPLSVAGVAEVTEGKTKNSGGKDVPVVDVNKIFRREFKIKGQIGLPGDENKLSFISLARQIESGLERGYEESEVIESVIRAISPGMPLRSYLESTPDLNLARLRQILRSHFRESNATDLYQKLASLTQLAKEDAQSFLMRALELRQKIIFASKEADVVIKYDQKLVQSLFLHCIETGLRDDVVRVKLRPLLQKPTVLDEELIREVTIAATTEFERKAKFLASQKQCTPKATCSHVATPGNDKENTDKMKVDPKGKGLVDQVAALQAEIASLRESMGPAGSTWAKPRPQGGKPRMCEACQNEKVERCVHCFRCGSTEHYARGCRVRPKQGNSGNRPGLPPRDRQ